MEERLPNTKSEAIARYRPAIPSELYEPLEAAFSERSLPLEKEGVVMGDLKEMDLCLGEEIAAHPDPSQASVMNLGSIKQYRKPLE